MVLGRHPKKFKLFMRNILTSLVQHQQITTTKAKAKHMLPHAIKLIAYSRRAYNGQSSALNLLKGRIFTEKAYKKLLLQIAPKLKDLKGPYITMTKTLRRRRGDNAPMVSIGIKGNEKDQYRKRRWEQMVQNGQIFNKKAYQQARLLEQKQFFRQMMQKQPEKREFFEQRIVKVQKQQWINNKKKSTLPKYSLLL